MVFGLSGNNPGGRPDLGLTMQADYYGNQAVVKGFSLVNGRVSELATICMYVILILRACTIYRATEFSPRRGLSFFLTPTPHRG